MANDSSAPTSGHIPLGFSAAGSLTLSCAQSTVGARDVTQPGYHTGHFWLLKRPSSPEV